MLIPLAIPSSTVVRVCALGRVQMVISLLFHFSFPSLEIHLITLVMMSLPAIVIRACFSLLA